MKNPVNRLVAYSSAPDVYDPPTPDECKAAALLLAQCTDTLKRIVRKDDDAYNWAVWTLGSLKGLVDDQDRQPQTSSPARL